MGFFFLYGYGAPLGGPSGRRSSAIKPDANEDYMSLFSPSAPNNQFLLVVTHQSDLRRLRRQTQMYERPWFNKVHTQDSVPTNRFRAGRGQRPQTQGQGFTQRPCLGNRSSPSGNLYQKPQKGGGKSKETKP